MANTPIRAVIFDLGGTLEDVRYDDAAYETATVGLQALLRELALDPGLSLVELRDTVLSGIAAYQKWREQTEVELPPERVWTEYIFPNHGLPKKRLVAAAEEIALFYETHYYVRKLRAEAPGTLEALHNREFRLGVISNIMSRRLVAAQLAEYGVAHYFDPVITSVEFGRRKPDARIFLEAAARMKLPPSACAYVGDTISRDVVGARRAGYGLVIQIKSFLTDKADRGTNLVAPDATISDLTQILPLVVRGNGAIS